MRLEAGRVSGERSGHQTNEARTRVLGAWTWPGGAGEPLEMVGQDASAPGLGPRPAVFRHSVTRGVSLQVEPSLMEWPLRAPAGVSCFTPLPPSRGSRRPAVPAQTARRLPRSWAPQGWPRSWPLVLCRVPWPVGEGGTGHSPARGRGHEAPRSEGAWHTLHRAAAEVSVDAPSGPGRVVPPLPRGGGDRHL